MKKRERAHYELLPPVALYADDASALESLLRQIAPRLTINTDDHTLDTAAELLELPDVPMRVLTIESLNPYIKVHFDGRSNRNYVLVTPDSDANLVGLATLVKEFAQERRPRFWWLWWTRLGRLAIAISLCLLAFMIVFPWLDRVRTWHAMLVGCLAAFATTPLQWFRWISRATIYTHNRTAKPSSLFDREKIATSVVASLTTAGLIGAASLIYRALTKSH